MTGSTPTVDGHLHVFRAVSDRYPRDVHELFPADLEAPVEELLATMTANGVEHAVLVPLSPHDDYVADCLAAHPGRFAAVGVHDPADPDPVASLHRRVRENGIDGLRVHHLGDPAVADVEELSIMPLLRALAEGGHKLWFYGSPQQLELLERVLPAVDDLPVVLNHLGFCQQGYEKDEWGRPRIPTPLPPPTLPTVERLAALPRVHVMFSGWYAFSARDYPYDDLRSTVDALVTAYGPQRMVWASDWPWIKVEPGYEALLALIDHFLPGLSGAERSAVAGGTAARLFGLGDARRSP